MEDTNALIVDYWNRRSTLNEREWETFARLLFAMLMRTRNLPSIFNDKTERIDVITRFISERVILNARTTQAGDIQHAAAIFGFLKNFCISEVRDTKRNLVSLDENQHGEEGGDYDDAPDEINAAAHVSIMHRQVLEEAGIDVDAACASATSFVNTLEEAERGFLAHNTCADDSDSIPMSALGERYGIKHAYHYQAKKLGITGSKGGFYQGYESTKIGQWLTSVGAKISKDWQEEIALLFVILCHQVRT